MILSGLNYKDGDFELIFKLSCLMLFIGILVTFTTLFIFELATDSCEGIE